MGRIFSFPTFGLAICTLALSACHPVASQRAATLGPTLTATAIAPSPTSTPSPTQAPTPTALPPTATATPTRPAATPTATPPPPTPTQTAGPGKVIVNLDCSQVDAPGDDTKALAEEYICLENTGGTPVAMGGWTLSDRAKHRYVFPEYTLPAGGRVRVRTGSGGNTATDLYWGQRSAVWNNDHDTVYLHDAAGNLVDEKSY